MQMICRNQEHESCSNKFIRTTLSLISWIYIDKVIISDLEGIEEFYKNSYIGNVEKTREEKEILILSPVETLLLC